MMADPVGTGSCGPNFSNERSATVLAAATVTGALDLLSAGFGSDDVDETVAVLMNGPNVDGALITRRMIGPPMPVTGTGPGLVQVTVLVPLQVKPPEKAVSTNPNVDPAGSTSVIVIGPASGPML